MVHGLQCGPRLRPSLKGPSSPRVGTHSNWFPDRSSFRGRFKLANRSRLTSDLSDYPILYATACQLFMAFPIALRGEEARRPLYTVASLSNVSYLKLLRFNSSKNELSTDEDWSLSIWASYRGAIIYRLFRRRLMIISRRTHPDFSSSNDLREDRTIREFFLLSFYKRTALFSSIPRDPSGPEWVCQWAWPHPLILSSKQTRTFYTSWLWANWNCFTLRIDKMISLSAYRFQLQDCSAHVACVRFPSLTFYKLMEHC